jgi:hypothetical protein
MVVSFGSAKGTYFLRRSQESPPSTLAAKLWPWVDAAVADYAAGGCSASSCKTPPYCSRNSRCRVSGGSSSLKPTLPPFAERVRAAETVQKNPSHVAIRGVIPIVADAMSAVGNRLSVGQDRLLRATLTTPAVTADLVRQGLQDQTTELTAILSAATGTRRGTPRGR